MRHLALHGGDRLGVVDPATAAPRMGVRHVHRGAQVVVERLQLREGEGIGGGEAGLRKTLRDEGEDRRRFSQDPLVGHQRRHAPFRVDGQVRRALLLVRLEIDRHGHIVRAGVRKRDMRGQRAGVGGEVQLHHREGLSCIGSCGDERTPRSHLRLFSGRDKHPCEHQREADQVKQLRPLAQKCDGHGRAEHRDQVKERCRPVGPDQLDAAVETQVSEHGGKDHHIRQRQHARGRHHDRRPVESVPDHQRDQRQRADSHGEAEERQVVDRRPSHRQRRINPEDRQCRGEDHVAPVEPDGGERAQIPAGQDGQHADQRDRDAQGLHPGQPDAQQHQRPHRDEQRARGLQQQGVEGLGILQAIIGQRVVDADAGQRQKQHQSQLLADGGPVGGEVPPGQRQDQQRRAAPADKRQCERRHHARQMASDNDVAGPEQRGQAQQQIRLLPEPADRRGPAGQIGNRHSCGTSVAAVGSARPSRRFGSGSGAGLPEARLRRLRQ